MGLVNGQCDFPPTFLKLRLLVVCELDFQKSLPIDKAEYQLITTVYIIIVGCHFVSDSYVQFVVVTFLCFFETIYMII